MFAQTRTVGWEAPGAWGTVARFSTVLAKVAHWALLMAPIPGVAWSTAALSSESVAEATIVAETFLGAVGSMKALWTGQGADDAHPARWAAAGALGALEDTPILARRGAGAEEASSALGTGHITAGPCSPWRAEAGSGLGITGCPVTLAAELAGRAIVVRGTRPKAVWRLQARQARTYPSLGITGAAVATAAGLVTLWPPHSWATLTGTIDTPPAWCTLALIGCHAAAMDTLLGTERDTGPAALVEALAAPQARAVVHLYHLTVHSPVDNRGLGADVGTLPGPVTGLRGV